MRVSVTVESCMAHHVQLRAACTDCPISMFEVLSCDGLNVTEQHQYKGRNNSMAVQFAQQTHKSKTLGKHITSACMYTTVTHSAPSGNV